MRPIQILSSALLCTSVASASAWPWSDNTLGAALGDLLMPHKRSPQAVTLGDSDAATPNPTDPTTTAQKTTATNTNSGTATKTGDSTQTGTNSQTGTASQSGSGTKSGTASNTASGTNSGGKSSSKPTQTTFDPRLPAGGLSMITPNPRSQTQYYKIGNYVTFAWNYTSLSVTPSAIDILASCSKNQATYTIALNQTVDGPTGAVTWDTNGQQATPLLTETYTLVVYDAAKSVSASPAAGYLGTFNQFTFGMYSPQPYTPLDQYVCVTCSGALSAFERQSLAVLGVAATAAVLGATWFTTGLGVLL